jgi:hypothetical protein
MDPSDPSRSTQAVFRAVGRVAWGIDGMCPVIVDFENRDEAQPVAIELHTKDGTQVDIAVGLDQLLSNISAEPSGRSAVWSSVEQLLDRGMLKVYEAVVSDANGS